MIHIELSSKGDSKLLAKINKENGQTYSLTKNQTEFMHGEGRPKEYKNSTPEQKARWPNSEIIMFPIVSQSENNYIRYNETKYPLDQHGIIRAIKPEIVYDPASPNLAKMIYTYFANDLIDNSERHAKNSKNPKEMYLPFGFKLTKEIILNDTELHANFYINNTGNSSFCYALGWHPAFLTQGQASKGEFIIENKTIDNIEDLTIKSQTSAHTIKNTKILTYINYQTNKGVEITSDFGGFDLWAPNHDMFCIEPITDKKKKGAFIDLSRKGKEETCYDSFIEPGETRKYFVRIKPILE